MGGNGDMTTSGEKRLEEQLKALAELINHKHDGLEKNMCLKIDHILDKLGAMDKAYSDKCLYLEKSIEKQKNKVYDLEEDIMPRINKIENVVEVIKSGGNKIWVAIVGIIVALVSSWIN